MPGKQDHYWWLHPAFRGEQTLQVSDAAVIPPETLLWVDFSARYARPNDDTVLPANGGPHSTLAKLLFKMNNYRPGPVTGWYVVVCVEEDKRWAVGQLRADVTHPLQVFEDLVFDSEDEARERALNLRGSEPGVTIC